MSPCLFQHNLDYFRDSLPLDMLSNLIMQIHYVTHKQKKIHIFKLLSAKSEFFSKNEMPGNRN